MEILLACLIATLVVKNGVIDTAYAVRGKPSPRRSVTHELLKHRAASSSTRQAAGPGQSAFRRYAAQLWDDSWDEARQKHDRRLQKRRQRRAERDAAGPSIGALHHYLRTIKLDTLDSWDRHWDQASTKRHERRTAGQAQALASALIAAAEATNANRGSELPDIPDAPEQDGSPTIPTIPADATEPCRREGCDGSLEPVPGTIHCDEGDGGAMVDTRCGRCGLESYHSWPLSDSEFETEFGYPFGERPDEEPDDTDSPDAADPSTAATSAPTAQPGTTGTGAGETASVRTHGAGLATVHPLDGSTQEALAVTITNGETNTLSQTLGAIGSWEESTQQAVTSLETSIANLQGSEVGPAVTGPLTKAQEAFSQALAAFVEARDGLEPSTQIGDMYHSNPDAGDRDFVTG